MDTLKRTDEWFKLAVPEPDRKNFNSQLGCHCEEVEEMLDCLNGADVTTKALLSNVREHIRLLSWHLKNRSQFHLVDVLEGCELEFLDALCDQTVTATGVAHMMGHDFIGAMNEVNRSNFSKFVDGKPVFNANSKIIKGSQYTEPNLKPFLKV